MKAFKDFWKSRKSFGISEAGQVPNSLLAEQDLECETCKGAVEQTGKELDKMPEKAQEADTKKEKNQIIGRIKNIQLKRQEAVLEQREKNMSKSFKEFWKEMKKGGPGSGPQEGGGSKTPKKVVGTFRGYKLYQNKNGSFSVQDFEGDEYNSIHEAKESLNSH